MKLYSKLFQAHSLKYIILTIIILLTLSFTLSKYQQLSLYREIRQGVEPGFPARLYTQEIVSINDDKTRAFVIVTSIVSCQNMVGRTFDITVTLLHDIWTISEIGTEKLISNLDCDL